MAETTATRSLALLVCAGALAALAGCGGAGSASAVPGAPQTPIASAAPASTGNAANAAVPGAPGAIPVAASAGPAPTLGGCQLFPANAIFNTRIDDASRFPVHPDSGAWLDLAGRSLAFGANWGVNADPSSGSYWGVPINVIDAAGSGWPVVSFDFSSSGVSQQQGYPAKSDCAVPDGSGFAIAHDCTSVPPSQRHFPFPREGTVLSEAGACNDPNSCGDHHLLVVEQGACRLWESYFSYELGGQWYSMATAAWDLNSVALRPDNWASADAAGLPLVPLLAKAAEANSGEIRHALSVNFRDAALSLQHVWPARFAAGADNPGAIPFGALLRLKAGFAIPDAWTVQAKAIATAAKRYGMYVTDNGADFSVQGEPSGGWDAATSQQLKSITLDDMEFVDLRSVTGDPRFSPDSMAASW